MYKYILYTFGFFRPSFINCIIFVNGLPKSVTCERINIIFMYVDSRVEKTTPIPNGRRKIILHHFMVSSDPAKEVTKLHVLPDKY